MLNKLPLLPSDPGGVRKPTFRSLWHGDLRGDSIPDQVRIGRKRGNRTEPDWLVSTPLGWAEDRIGGFPVNWGKNESFRINEKFCCVQGEKSLTSSQSVSIIAKVYR